MSTATAELITVPGVYDIPAEEYHQHPALSSSGARRLLECPSKYAYEREHRPTPTEAFDLGHAAHREVLGVGAELVVVDAPDWRTNKAKEAKAKAHAAGKTPILAEQHAQVLAMVAALRAHPFAGKLFTTGTAEQALFWHDEPTGVMLRALLDWRTVLGSGRPVVVDYKTTPDASERALRRSTAKYGYYAQAAFYLDGVTALGLADDPAFVLVHQETSPPYEVVVSCPTTEYIRVGRAANRRAIDLYAEYMAAGHWPGYADDVLEIEPPSYLIEEYL